MAFHAPNKFMVDHPILGKGDGNSGFFIIPNPIRGMPQLRCIASDGLGWEHVSVSKKIGLPSWHEMCFIKDLFWDEEDTVAQFHPKRSEYVSNAEVLHLWRRIGSEFELPDSIMVGFKNV